MKQEKDKPDTPEVVSPQLSVPPPFGSPTVSGSPSPSVPTPGSAPPAAPSPAVKVQQVSKTIHRIAVIVGLCIPVVGAAARSRIFGTGLGKFAMDAN